MLRRAGLLVFVGLVTIGVTRAAAADPPKLVAGDADAAKEREKRALALHDEASRLYEEGRYRDAIRKLEEALTLDPQGKELVYNLALIHEKLAELDEAEKYYSRYLTMDLDPRAAERTKGVLRRIEGAKRERDRQRAAVAPHAPRAAPRGGEPAAPSRAPSTWVLVSGSVAAGAFITGTVFGITALAKAPGPEPRTGNGVSIDDLKTDAETAHRSAVIADVAFAISGAAAAAALLLQFAVPPAEPAKATARLDAGLGGARLTVRF